MRSFSFLEGFCGFYIFRAVLRGFTLFYKFHAVFYMLYAFNMLTFLCSDSLAAVSATFSAATVLIRPSRLQMQSRQPAISSAAKTVPVCRLPSAVVSNSLALTRVSLLYIALLLCFTVPLSRSFYCFQPCPFPARQSLARFSAVFRIPFPLPNILLKTLIHTCRFFAAYTCFSQF